MIWFLQSKILILGTSLQELTISKKPAVRVNAQIKATTVRLISVDGKQIGIVPIAEALLAAKEKNLDLVEVEPFTTKER